MFGAAPLVSSLVAIFHLAISPPTVRISDSFFGRRDDISGILHACIHGSIPLINPTSPSRSSMCAVRVRAPFVSSIDVGFMVVPLQCERDERRGREDERDSHSAIAKCRGEERSASHSGLRSRPLSPPRAPPPLPFYRPPAPARQPPMILPHSLPHTRITGCRHTKMTFKHDLLHGVHDMCMPQELLCIVS